MGALDGFRMIDLTEGLCGPHASMRLGDAGVDVVKVEPLGGDCARGMGPPFVGGESSIFLALNRNKRSIAIDLDSDEGRRLVARLAEGADVMLEDLGPGRADAVGLGHEALAASNPGLVTCSISAWGEEGPMRDLPGAEVVVQAFAEYTRSLGRIGEPPVRFGADVGNLNTAVFASQAVTGALLHRLRSGRGQRVAVSMLRVLLHMRGIMWAARTNPDGWWGFHLDHYTNPPEHGYQAADGRLFFGLRRADSEDFDRLMIELGLVDHVTDERFGNHGRNAAPLGRYVEEARSTWESAFEQHTIDELRRMIQAAGGDAVGFNDYPSLVAHPQIEAIEAIDSFEHPTAGTLRTIRPVARHATTPSSIRRAPPLLGQHTDEVLAEIGIRAEQVAELRTAGVVA